MHIQQQATQKVANGTPSNVNGNANVAQVEETPQTEETKKESGDHSLGFDEEELNAALEKFEQDLYDGSSKREYEDQSVCTCVCVYIM